MPAEPSRVVKLPVDAKARRERRLAAAWAEQDRLEAALRVAKARARQLEREVSADRGINPTGSTLSAYVSKLSTAGVIEKDGSLLRLSAEVMG